MLTPIIMSYRKNDRSVLLEQLTELLEQADIR